MDIQQSTVELVVARLTTMPPDVKLSIGRHGTFSKDQLISEVKNGTKLGKQVIEMQLNYLRKMPGLSESLAP